MSLGVKLKDRTPTGKLKVDKKVITEVQKSGTEKKVKFICSAATSPDKLYVDGDGAFAHAFEAAMFEIDLGLAIGEHGPNCGLGNGDLRNCAHRPQE